MPIGNQAFDTPIKYRNQVGVWCPWSKFIGIFLVLYRYPENDPVIIIP